MKPNIINGMEIDWIKVSEIVFQALLTAIISAGLVYLAFRLGQRQAREEQKEREENELNLRRIDELKELIENFKILLYAFDFESARNGQYLITGFADDFMPKAWKFSWELDKIIPFFPSNHDQDTHNRLIDLKIQINNMSNEYDDWARIGEQMNIQMNINVERLTEYLIDTQQFILNKIQELVEEFG